MPPEKLGGGVDHNIRAPLDGPHQRGRCARVVDDERQLVLVRDGGELFNVDNIQLRIAKGLGIDEAGLAVDGFAQAVEVVRIHEANRNAELRQRVVEEVVGAPVERGGRHDLVAGIGQRGGNQRLRCLP